MVDFSLVPTPPLAGTNLTIGENTLYSPSDLAIVSIALPLGAEEAAQKAIKSAFGVGLPEPGKSVLGKSEARLVRLGTDQGLIIFSHDSPDAETVVQKLTNGKVYTTDQSDAWVGLCLTGETCRDALERICPIDLNGSVFAVDDIARTAMEHLGVLVIRTEPNVYMLLSASSSAQSFLHAVETSMRNIA